MTIYILSYSTDYGNESHAREPFTSKAEAIKAFNVYKKKAIEEDNDEDRFDISRTYHIAPDAKPEDHITKWVVNNTKDLIKMIRYFNL